MVLSSMRAAASTMGATLRGVTGINGVSTVLGSRSNDRSGSINLKGWIVMVIADLGVAHTGPSKYGRGPNTDSAWFGSIIGPCTFV